MDGYTNWNPILFGLFDWFAEVRKRKKWLAGHLREAGARKRRGAAVLQCDKVNSPSHGSHDWGWFISAYITHKNGYTSPYIIHISSIYHPYLYHHISPWLGESLDPPWHQWQYSPVTGLTMNMTNSSKTFMEYPRVLTLLIHTNPFSLICIYIYIDIQLYTYNIYIYIYYIYILSTRQTSWWM